MSYRFSLSFVAKQARFGVYALVASLAVTTGFGVVFGGAGCGGQIGTSCVVNSECHDDALICAIGHCHVKCKTSADCDYGQLCFKEKETEASFCGEPIACTKSAECGAGGPWVCEQNKCRNGCDASKGNTDCLAGQECVPMTKDCVPPQECPGACRDIAEKPIEGWPLPGSNTASCDVHSQCDSRNCINGICKGCAEYYDCEGSGVINCDTDAPNEGGKCVRADECTYTNGEYGCAGGAGGMMGSSSNGSSSSSGSSSGTGGVGGMGGMGGAGGMMGSSSSSSSSTSGSSSGGGGTGGTGGMGGAGGMTGSSSTSSSNSTASSSSSSGAGGAGKVVINEFDYDQPDADGPEFVEIYNGTSQTLNLANLVIIVVNAGNMNHLDINLPLMSAGSLPPGGYLVVARTGVVVAPLALKVELSLPIDNTGPNGIALVDTTTYDVIDALCYGVGMGMLPCTVDGFSLNGHPINFVEDTPTTVVDSNVVPLSLCRWPNGQDTDNALADWHECTTLTPGGPNIQ